MQTATLEHINISVRDPRKTAEFLCQIFDWSIRWEGPSLGDGYTVHVGNDRSYIALYNPGEQVQRTTERFRQRGGLNHIAVVVEDIEAVENLVRDVGFTPENFADYEPGKRFYFTDDDGVEYEVVSYSA